MERLEAIGYYYYSAIYKKYCKNFPFLCIMGTYYNYNTSEHPNYVVIDYKSLAVSKEEFIKFINIMNFWGFPVILEQLDEGFKCTFPNKKYTNDKHFLAAVTIFRYTIKCELMYAQEFETNGVIPAMFEFKTKYPKLSYFQCFQLGCYKSMSGGHNQGHSCFKVISTLVKHKELKAKLVNPVTSNNLYFKKEIVGYEGAAYHPVFWRKMHELINKDEKAALKLLL